LGDLETHAHLIDETFERVAKVEWWANPWREAAGAELAAFVATPMDKWREAMSQAVEAATAADATIDPLIPPFVENLGLVEQGASRAALADRIEHAIAQVPADVRARWAGRDEQALARAQKRLAEVEPQLAMLRDGAPDTELAMIARERLPGMAELASQLGGVEAYLQIAQKWYAFLPLKGKSMGRDVLAKYGLALSVENARRLKAFLIALRARLVLQGLHYELYAVPQAAGLLSDDVLARTLAEHREVIELMLHVHRPESFGLAKYTFAVLIGASSPDNLLTGLRKSPARAAAIVGLLEKLSATRLIAEAWLTRFELSLRGGGAASDTIGALSHRLGDVESILRIRAALTKLPQGIRTGIETLSAQPIDPETAVGAIRKSALAAEITRRLAGDPRLQNVDGQRVSGAFDRYRKLEEKKRGLVRDVILHQWTSRQKERLLASTGSRLGSAGRRAQAPPDHARRARHAPAPGARRRAENRGRRPALRRLPRLDGQPRNRRPALPAQGGLRRRDLRRGLQCRWRRRCPC
jgi:hypothetical protein